MKGVVGFETHGDREAANRVFFEEFESHKKQSTSDKDPHSSGARSKGTRSGSSEHEKADTNREVESTRV